MQRCRRSAVVFRFLSCSCGSNRLERTGECEEHRLSFFFSSSFCFVWFRWMLRPSEQGSCGADWHSLLTVEEDWGRVQVFLLLELSGGLGGSGQHRREGAAIVAWLVNDTQELSSG